MSLSIPKMQPTIFYVSQFFYFNKMLYMFQAVPPPIIRSSNCTYSFWYLSTLAATCCYHDLDGIRLRNVAFCWLHFGNTLKTHGLMNIKCLSLSVRPHGTTRFPLDGFSRNLIFVIFRKSVEKIQIWLNSDKNSGYFRRWPTYIYDTVSSNSS
jgi:hypothetical protein